MRLLPRPRISLRLLFLIVAIIATMLGWQVKRQRETRRAIEAIEAKGGMVFDEDQLQYGIRVFPGSTWIGDLTGDNALNKLHSVALTNELFNDDDVALLRLMPSIRQLSVSGSRVTDAGLEDILTLPQLAVLDVSDSAVTGLGLQNLSASKSVRQVYISTSQLFPIPPQFTLPGIRVQLVR